VEADIWIQRFETPKLESPVAVVGSPGLRSIGKLAVDSLIAQTKAQLIAELYSTHLPSIHQTIPSYAADPTLPGMGGVIVESGKLDMPKVELYACTEPPLVFAKGYHANFAGQFTVAKKVVEFLGELGVKRMVVVAGYGTKDKKICCAANTQKALDDMKTKYDIGISYKGPFMGFSGLVFGLSTKKKMESICLFSGTQPKQDDLEFPDMEASDRAVALLYKMLGLQKP
jgi:proteasome assembly chaperone (PAC2) family protein